MGWQMEMLRMVQMVEMVGRKFGRLTVIEKVGRIGLDFLWRCECECGGERVSRGQSLRYKAYHTCTKCQQIFDEGDFMRCVVPHGAFFIFDREDLDLVNSHQWIVAKNGEQIMPTGRDPKTKKYITSLPRMITNAEKGMFVSPKNGIYWDLRRNNLLILPDEYKYHVRKMPKNQCGFKGVQYCAKSKNKYKAQINVEKQAYILGYFNTPQEAADVYDDAALEKFGEHAWTNRKERDKIALLLELGSNERGENPVLRRRNRRGVLVGG
jgi:hypothetical protein